MTLRRPHPAKTEQCPHKEHEHRPDQRPLPRGFRPCCRRDRRHKHCDHEEREDNSQQQQRVPGHTTSTVTPVRSPGSLNLTIQRKRRTLKLALRCGDLQVGYFDLDLAYGAVDCAASNLRDLASVARNIRSEAQYDEIEIDTTNGEARVIHRIIFDSKGQIEVVFVRLNLKLVPPRGRDFASARRVHGQIPPDARRLLTWTISGGAVTRP